MSDCASFSLPRLLELCGIAGLDSFPPLGVFSSEFIAAIEGAFGNARSFCAKTGASNSYMTDIRKRGRLPTLRILRAWLSAAEFPAEEVARLEFLCRVDRLRADEGSAPLWALLVGHVKGSLSNRPAQNFGAALRRIRIERGLTIQELARRSETAAGTISLVERNRRPPPADSVAKWIAALGLPAEESEALWPAALRQRMIGNSREKAFLAHIGNTP